MESISESDSVATAVFHSVDDVPDSLESIVAFLLDKLAAPSTVTRWSAGKGLSTIADYLSDQYVDNILEHLLLIFEEGADLLSNGDVDIASGASEDAWHGVCLALAEFLRRFLAQPHFIGRIISRSLQVRIYSPV